MVKGKGKRKMCKNDRVQNNTLRVDLSESDGPVVTGTNWLIIRF